ncbi:MAG: CPBP family intramembrane metalloprotease [Phycisphaeraceae bacterium]|nr:CPBP family intramembrane metalloprotease [Phycisphaeraceae bacterium]
MAQSKQSLLSRLDQQVATHVWYPRLLPFFLYVSFLALMGLDGLFARLADMTAKLTPLSGALAGLAEAWRHPLVYPLLYVTQCTLVLWLLWRYRKLTPELKLSFHWLALPVGVFVTVAWVVLGWWMAGEFSQRWAALMDGQLLGPLSGQVDEADFRLPQNMGHTVGWTALILRLAGMSIVVPMFEEMFIRSLMLRGLSEWRKTWIGVQQLFCDLPGVGEWFIHTRAGERASRHPPVFSPMFVETPLGKLTVFGVCASTLVFMFSHVFRDWPGVWACGIAYCLLLGYTTRNGKDQSRGLGPVIWAHGITNALLWVYTVYSGDWQFL